jgi:anti-anti-sigma factor
LELNLSGDLRADAAEEVLKSIQQSWTQHSQGLELKLNLAQVNFMDSTGLSVLIRSFKMTSLRPGASFSLTNATPAVRNVLQLARLDHVFGLHS